MHSIPHGCCDLYLKECLLPRHCETCECSRSELQVTRKIPKPACCCGGGGIKTFSRHYLSDLTAPCCCPCKGTVVCDFCLCYECRKIHGRSEATISRSQRGKFERLKYSLLETWFDRFDTDRDGFLNLMDLESLLKYLGAKIRNSYAKRILQACDRDSDGRLSFPEFVQLWLCAAHHNEDFIKSTGCPELSHIVKKYKLFSDGRHCACHDYHSKHVTFSTKHPAHKVKCKCGQGTKILPFIKHEDQVHSSIKKSKAKVVSEDTDKLPVMSMNRNNIV